MISRKALRVLWCCPPMAMQMKCLMINMDKMKRVLCSKLFLCCDSDLQLELLSGVRIICRLKKKSGSSNSVCSIINPTSALTVTVVPTKKLWIELCHIRCVMLSSTWAVQLILFLAVVRWRSRLISHDNTLVMTFYEGMNEVMKISSIRIEGYSSWIASNALWPVA